MFESLHTCLLSQCAVVAERAEGVAFFRAAKDLYGLASINYVCVNISMAGRSRYFAHCVYSDTCVKQLTSSDPVRFELKNESGPGLGSIHVPANGTGRRSPTQVILTLNKRRGETAFFGIISAIEPTRPSGQHDTMLREYRILANYFHGHILRMNGYEFRSRDSHFGPRTRLLEVDRRRQDRLRSQHHFGNQRANSQVSFECGAGEAGLRDDDPSRCQGDCKSANRNLN